MLEVMNYIWRTYNQKIPITFDLGEFEFYDYKDYYVTMIKIPENEWEKIDLQENVL